jgi:queuine tRNA-ribosyltransferase
MHNVHYQLELMREARDAILEDRYPAFVKEFFAQLYPEGAPQWARDALKGVGVVL